MRIGYLVPEFPGQTHIFYWRELKELRELGVEPVLLSTRPPPRRLSSHSWSAEAAQRTVYLLPKSSLGWISALASTLRTHYRKFPGVLSEIARTPSSLKAKARLLASAVVGAHLERVLRANGCEHVHVHSAASSADVAMYAAKFGRCTYSLTLHGALEGYGGNQQAKWSAAAFGIVVTQTLKRELLRQTNIEAGKLSVRAMGVDLAKWRRQNPFRPYDGTGEFRIFSCGRLNYAKGHQDLIEAVSELRDAGIAVRLVIAGEDDDGGTGFRPVLEAQIKALGLGDAVQLLGAIPEEQVIAELESAHCFALASHEEAIGVALMEAMIMEVPTIATDVGGVHELVTSRDQAMMVKPQDVRQLAAALLSVRNYPKLAKKLSVNGAARVREAFSADASAIALVERLNTLTSADPAFSASAGASVPPVQRPGLAAE